ncbi:MAG TPA: hypothetical protein VGC50_03220 [Gammaproteobacteria bacterium]|jgi:hypothetical protein
MFDFTKHVPGWLIACGAAVWVGALEASPAPAVDAAVADLAGRIDYGFYAAEPRLISAAREALDRLPDSAPGKTYYQAYAAYRLGRLESRRDQRMLRSLVADCVEHASLSAKDARWAVEAWILAGACSLMGAREDRLKTIMHELRFDEAIAQAARLDAAHPRLLLLRAWAESAPVDGASPAPGVKPYFERAVEGFEDRGGAPYAPDWGRAEALAGLAELHLEVGGLRDARDLIERALLEAPDYRFALELEKELSLRR